MNKPNKIADNPSSKELLDQLKALEGFEALYDLLPWTGRIFPKLRHFFSDFAEIKKQAEVLLLPDQFNEIFAPLGWIAYESLSVEVMGKAIEIARSQATQNAEEYLADHYDAETLKWEILRFKGDKEFRRRIRLFELARDDYHAGRYHACVPLLLSLTDGLVNDISKHLGFFAENSDMTAWGLYSRT